MKLRNRILRICCACIVAALLCQGCDDDDDYRDHDPPAGQGSLVVDNLTSIDFNLFIDGESAGEVKDGRERIIDLDPGIRRLVLDDDDDIYGSFRDDIDILEGQLTILRIYHGSQGSPSGYTVTIEFD